MVEPLSILSAVGAVSKLAYSCTTSIYSFVQSTANVDSNVKSLFNEVEQLRQTSVSVESVLRRPELEAFQDAELWTNAESSLRACEGSLLRLDQSLRGLKPHRQPKNIFRKPVTQIKLDLTEEQIKSFRSQVQSHTLALHTLLHMINVHVASSGPSIVLDHVMPMLSELTYYVRALKAQHNFTGSQEVDTGVSVEQDESFMTQMNQGLANAATMLMIEVATAIEGDTRSTIFGGTEPDLDFESCVGGVQLPVTHVTSEVRELSTSFDRISDWVAARMPQEDENEGNSSSARTPMHNPREEGSANISDLYTKPGEVIDDDSDEDIEVDLAGRYVSQGRIAASQGRHSQAEENFLRALRTPRLLARLREPVFESTLKHELAVSLLAQDNVLGAKSICEELVKLKINDDNDRARSLDAAYMLAQVLFREGALSAAEQRCLQVMKGRKRLNASGETSQAYYNAVWLMVTIREVQNDVVDVQAYSAMIPQDFTKPFFKIPMQGSTAHEEATLSNLSAHKSPTTPKQQLSEAPKNEPIETNSVKKAVSHSKSSSESTDLPRSTMNTRPGRPDVDYSPIFKPLDSSRRHKIPFTNLDKLPVGIMPIAFSPDGQFVACGGKESTWLWNLKQERVHLELTGHTDAVRCIAFSPDGSFMATGSLDYTMKLWDTKTWIAIRENKDHTRQIRSMTFSHDGKLLASGSADKKIILWNTSTGKSEELGTHTRKVSSVAFSPNGKLLASGSWDKTLRLWNLCTGKYRELEGHTRFVNTIAFSPDGKVIASGSSDCTVRLWNVSTRAVQVITEHTETVWTVAFSPNGRLLASGSVDRTIRIRDMASGASRVLDAGIGVWQIAFSPDGRTLASISYNQEVRLWDLTS